MILTGICLSIPFLIRILHKQKKAQDSQRIDEIESSLSSFEHEPSQKEIKVLNSPEPEEEPEPEAEAMLVVDPYPTRERSESNFEELLEKGFKEKDRGAYQQAAEYFYLALITKPEPDLAYYLITDSYGLWKSVNSAEMAFSRLEPFIRDFQNEAPVLWQKRLNAWFLENQIKF